MTNPESRTGSGSVSARLPVRPPNATGTTPLSERQRQPRDDLTVRRPTTSFHHPSALRGYGSPVPQDRSLYFGLPMGEETLGISGNSRRPQQSPALFSKEFLTNHAVNIQNREYYMQQRSTGDTQANVPPRPPTSGSSPKVNFFQHLEGSGHKYPPTAIIPLAPLPLGTRIPTPITECRTWKKTAQEDAQDGDSQAWTSPPPPAKPNPTHTQVPIQLIFNPAHDQMLDSTWKYQQMFSTEVSPSPADSFLSGNEVTLESVPQSPLDQSFTPVSRYLSGHISAALRLEGVTHPKTSLLRTCDQCVGIPIDLLVDNLKKVKKLNEGVYGEVYSGYFDNVPEPSVYKVVAVEGSKLVNGEKQKRYAEIEPEIRISQRLNSLRNPYAGNYTRGFCRLYRARLMEGKYPSVLVDAWIKWHAANESENECPNVFDRSQRYIVFEYEFGGTDVESFRFLNAEQAYALLMQVAFTLATGEAGCEFEHRDLHWGNILVMNTTDKIIPYKIGGVHYRVPTAGVKTTVIDFTISRSLDKNNNPTFTDMAEDEDQFLGTDGYQFEIYRMMRELNGNKWDTFHPKTNIFWLHYLVDKLMTHARYTQTSSGPHRAAMKKLKEFEEVILQYDSCQEFTRSQLKYMRSD